MTAWLKAEARWFSKTNFMISLIRLACSLHRRWTNICYGCHSMPRPASYAWSIILWSILTSSHVGLCLTITNEATDGRRRTLGCFDTQWSVVLSVTRAGSCVATLRNDAGCWTRARCSSECSGMSLTELNLIAIWSPTANFPNLHCALLATTPSGHHPYKSNPNSNSSHTPN